MSSFRKNNNTDGFKPQDILQVKLPDDGGFTGSRFVDVPEQQYQPGSIVRKEERKRVVQQRQKKVQASVQETAPAENDQPPPNPAPPQIPDPPPPEPPVIEPVTPEPQITQEEVDQLVENAFSQGVEEGLKRAEHDLLSATKALTAICEQLNTTRETILQNSMPEMKDLVITIAEKIIRHSVTAQNDTILTTVEQALHQSVKSDKFLIYLNPKDYNTVKEKEQELIDDLGALENIMIRVDQSIEQGGCRIESDNCMVDATISSQINLLADALKTSR